ncbi:hypothetical protein NW765_016652 [Fusarium oxysporum]|nr:hypothetical protein NW765_016652 [Fusarium oxysporum]
MQYRVIMAATLAIGAYAAPAPLITGAPSLSRRQDSEGGSGGSGGSSVLDAPMTIAAGESFDGGNAIFDRGVSCTGQAEGGDSDAVFILEKGATLSNVRIGPNQIEGVHCNGGCTLNNVVWDAVCEDAFSIKKQEDGETTTINGGGATGAEDKVIQHNGGGTVIIKDFEVSDFGKLYRSCGNCKEMPARHVEISGGSASNGKILVGINPNMGDTAKISGIQLTNVPKERLALVTLMLALVRALVLETLLRPLLPPTTPANGSETPAASEVADPVETSADGSQGDDQSGDDQSGDNDDGDKDESDDDKKDDDSDDENKDEQSDNENQDQDSESENQESADNQQAQPSQPNFSFGSGGFGGF